jgi:hypothetical protein
VEQRVRAVERGRDGADRQSGPADLSKTISGRIRQVELRGAETCRDQHEYWEEDFPDLKG